jgi:hypothetical protein
MLHAIAGKRFVSSSKGRAMHIIDYNARWIADRFYSTDSPLPEQYRSDAYSDEVFAAYRATCDFFESVTLVDRTGTDFPHFLPVKCITPMPKNAAGFHKTFETCALERAAALVGSGKLIELYWSGGIDSTSVLAALIRAGIKRDQLRIFLTWNSIFEYPLFYHKFVKDAFEVVRTTLGDVKYSLSLAADKIVVTGEHGDQVFGSLVIARFTNELLRRPYEEGIPGAVREFLAPLTAAAPAEVKTVYDWLWYCNFNMKWQGVKTRFLVRLDGPVPFWQERLMHFFDNDDFQRWSLANEEPKILSHQSSYKWPAKRFIHALTKDEEYLYKKGKVNSLRNVAVPGVNPWCFILEDGSKVYEEEALGNERIEPQDLIASDAHDPMLLPLPAMS